MIARGVIHEPNTAPMAAPELIARVLGKGAAGLLADDRLVGLDQLAQRRRIELVVEADARLRLGRLERLLEVIVVDAHDHVAIHLDEAAVAVIGEALVLGFLGETQRPSRR